MPIAARISDGPLYKYCWCPIREGRPTHTPNIRCVQLSVTGHGNWGIDAWVGGTRHRRWGFPEKAQAQTALRLLGYKVPTDSPTNRQSAPWRLEALCRQTGPVDDVFFPDQGGREPKTAVSARVCFRCRVREQCLRYALDMREEWGTWGGVPAPSRRRLQAEIDSRPQDREELILTALYGGAA